jgi:hypothetical protein
MNLVILRNNVIISCAGHHKPSTSKFDGAALNNEDTRNDNNTDV